MQIIINGEPTNVSEQLTALQLLQNLGITEKKLALEVNETIVPRSSLSQYIIQAGDTVEIIHAIGGG